MDDMSELPKNSLPEEEVSPEVPSKIDPEHYNPKRNLIELLKYGATGLLSFASSSALEAVAFTGAALSAGINPFINVDPKLAVMFMGLSYIPLAHGTLVNADKAWDSLEETGTSVSWWAKIGYDLSRKITKHRGLQKAATFFGFTAMELVKEVPWWAGMLGGRELMLNVSPEHYSPNMEFAFMTGANIAGAGYQYAQAGAVEGILQGLRHKDRLVEIANGKLDKFSKNFNNVVF